MPVAPALATQRHAIVSRRKAPSPGAAGMQQELESSIASRQLPSRSPMVGARPACTAFCCFSSLEKNFWAWLRICTAVFVLTWSVRQGQWDRGWGSAVSSGNGEPEALCGAPAPCARCACWPSPPRTLYLAPLPAVEPQRLHKALVLLIGPPLPLLGDGVGLAGLHERGGRAAVRRLISAAAGQIGTLNGGSWLVAGAVGCVMEGCESWEGGWARAGRRAGGTRSHECVAPRAPADCGRSWDIEGLLAAAPADRQSASIALASDQAGREGRVGLPFAWGGPSRQRRPRCPQGPAPRLPLPLKPC